MKVTFAAIALLSASISASAEVYKCTGKNGETIYSDSPCGKGAVVVDTSESEKRVGSAWDNYATPATKYDFPQLPEPLIGLDTKAARMGLEQWCGPTPKINRSVRLGHVSEQWVCMSNRYIYFEDGVLTSFQD